MKSAHLLVLLTLLLYVFSTEALYAHGGGNHVDVARTEEKAQDPDTSAAASAAAADHAVHVQSPATAHARPDIFPNKHPLVVHFPIVLLLVAADVQLCNILFLRRELDWITTVATITGFSTAYYVTKIAHPHTSSETKILRLNRDVAGKPTLTYSAGFVKGVDRPG